MNERAAKAARRVARAQGLMSLRPGARSAERRAVAPYTVTQLPGRPPWKLPRAIAAAHQSLSHRERGRRRVAWARI